ncbi:ATP-binding protein [Lysobacter sp. 22409]|uniref:ATP-binding protein n=1 Tax=Lysobacter sp. 22409 TaxID=3453917 RepID=UPI003F863D95
MKSLQTADSACPIIALDRFIQATRDSGYKGTASAISELVDNSIQAEARRIEILITAVDGGTTEGAIEVSVRDDGVGMDPFTLRQALRFGGSTRFGDRTGLGRYGMGLPNASLSQARHVAVYTWRQSPATPRPAGDGPAVFTSYLDVDEIAQKRMEEVPRPELAKSTPMTCSSPSGTLVVWSRCDRLDNRRVSTIARKLETELARRFRHYLWAGLRITINGESVRAFDPLYLHPAAAITGAQQFGDELRYEVCVDHNNPAVIGVVRVRFSELPVHEWQSLSNDAKRKRGISKGSGVSIVRAGREVDYGWFFMGAKHRENYDDWWRCEVHFDPVLDEAFGITHTKQQVRPSAHLLEALTSDIEAIARALSARARKAHQAIKQNERFSEAANVATRQDKLLKPLPKRIEADAKALLTRLEHDHPGLRKSSQASKYMIVESAIHETPFFSYARDQNKLILVLNPEHPFYREIYKPLVESELPRDQQLRTYIELFLLAAARSEAASAGKSLPVSKYRHDWSNTIATFFNDK